MRRPAKPEPAKKQTGVDVRLNQLRTTYVKVTKDDLISGIRTAKLKPGAVYQFTYRDLCFASEDGPPCKPIEGDIGFARTDDKEEVV